MAAKACDDPMDLGPFLQNYVMKNPFSESSLLAPTAATPAEASVEKAKTLRSATVRTLLYGKQCKVQSDDKISGLPKRSDADTENSDIRTKRLTVKRSLTAVSKVKSDGHKVQKMENRVDSSVDSATEKRPGFTLNMPVILYANPDEMMEKYGHATNCTGASERSQIESWLRDNYRYLNYNRRLFVSTQHLLLKAQLYFPDITGDTVDEIVHHVFPKSEKAPKRNGFAYLGLIARPEPDILENPVFMAALESVVSGMLPVRYAADKFGIRETSLAAAVAWTSVDRHTTVPEGATVPADGEVSQKPPRPTRVEEPKDLTTPVAKVAKTVTKRKRKAAAAGCVSDAVVDADHHASKSDSDDGFDLELMLQDALNASAGLDFAATSSRSPYPSSLTMRTVDETVPSVSSSSLVPIKIKIEPDDSVDSPKNLSIVSSECLNLTTSAKLPSSSSSPNFETNEHSLTSNESEKSSRNSRHSRLDSPSDKSNTASNASSPKLGHVQKETASSLRAELEAAQKMNASLQDELGRRDLQLAQLAENFFKLHEQFKQLSRQFQTVLGGHCDTNGFINSHHT